MKNPRLSSLMLVSLMLANVSLVRSQTQTTSPATKPPPTTPVAETQEPVKVFTEEVLIPLFVSDKNGRFDPTLEADDVLVFEDNVLQEVTSVRHQPSSVLLLLDTAGEKNPAMKTSTTREIATGLVTHLRPSCGGNSIRRRRRDDSGVDHREAGNRARAQDQTVFGQTIPAR